MRRDILRLLTREPIVPLFRRFQRGTATIFMLHRFADAAYGNSGHSIDVLRANLSFLRRRHYRLIGLTELLDELNEPRLPPAPAVVFTVDDGYGDFARLAAPVFAEFDCPVTAFVTTGFIDGGFWMWYDKVTWIFAQTTRTMVAVEVAGSRCRYVLDDIAARCRAAADLTEKLKRVPDAIAQAVLDELLRVAEVQLDREIPDRFLPMTWADVSRCAQLGVTFGPHTVTHPILSQVDEQRAMTEIECSWRRLKEATSAAIPVFCYPNGDYGSFSDRERRIVTSVGMRAAVLAEQHFTTSPHAYSESGQAVLELPRFSYPDDVAQFRQVVSGMERLKRTVRYALASPFRQERFARSRGSRSATPHVPLSAP